VLNYIFFNNRYCFFIFFLMILMVFSGCIHQTHAPNYQPRDDESVKQTAETNGSADVEIDKIETIESDEIFSSSPPMENNNLSTHLLVEEARELACTGALQYKNGNLDKARANLEAAIFNLQLADLPEDMQSISFFQPYLPEKCGTVDLLAAFSSLQEKKSGDFDSVENIPAAVAKMESGNRAFIEVEIVRLMEILGEDSSRKDELKIFTDEVEKFINYYRTTKNGWFERSYYRMMKYRDTVDSIFAEKRLPSELAYLAFIESGYMYRATSRSKARGIWQFIRSTGRNYGLKVGRGVDERLDPVKATIAAREYLLDLISIFGSESFLLAMASYNAGEGRVQRCLRKVDDPFEDRSFWKIRNCLRQETREYIPRIIAAAILCENPEKFGLSLKPRSEIIKEKSIVICPKRVRLSAVSKAAGINLKTLRQLNPDLPSGGSWTPVNNTHLYIPYGKTKAVQLALKKMKTAPKPTYSGSYHIVRRGESLYSIGRRHKIPYKRLADWNNIRSPYKIKPSQKIYLQPPSSKRTSTSGSKVTCDESLTYIVQKGNFLAGIGSIFGVTARDIMKLNNLRRGIIYPGQRLAVCPASPIEIHKYRVKSGETVTSVAAKHGVLTDEVLFTNGLSSRSTLHVGQLLTIYRRK